MVKKTMIISKEDAWLASVSFAMRIYETEDMTIILKAIKQEAGGHDEKEKNCQTTTRTT